MLDLLSHLPNTCKLHLIVYMDRAREAGPRDPPRQSNRLEGLGRHLGSMEDSQIPKNNSKQSSREWDQFWTTFWTSFGPLLGQSWAQYWPKSRQNAPKSAIMTSLVTKYCIHKNLKKHTALSHLFNCPKRAVMRLPRPRAFRDDFREVFHWFGGLTRSLHTSNTIAKVVSGMDGAG